MTYDRGARPPRGPELELDAQASLRQALEKAAAEWQMTFDSIESPILMLEANGGIRRLNRAALKLAGGSFRDWLSCPVTALGPGQPWERAAELAAEVRSAGAALSSQVHGSEDGRTWDLSASPVQAGGGQVDRVIVVAREITELVRLQESLRRGEMMAALGALVGGVAHEVRNPLFGISATLDAFDASFGENEEYREYISMLRLQVERLTELMRELIDYGRPATGEHFPGDLSEVIAESVDLCAPLAARSEVGLAVCCAPGLPRVLMERGRLVQVFHNLLENAIQHSPRGSSVRVAAEPEVGEETTWVACTVRDSGPGLRGEDIPRLFEPFFSRRPTGVGLGLSIVQRIVEEHGGLVSAGNQAGGGAVMSLRLPALPETVETEAPTLPAALPVAQAVAAAASLPVAPIPRASLAPLHAEEPGER